MCRRVYTRMTARHTWVLAAVTSRYVYQQSLLLYQSATFKERPHGTDSIYAPTHTPSTHRESTVYTVL